MATVFELVRSASAMLRASGVDTPEHDAKLLAAEVFGVDLQTVDKAMLMGEGLDSLAPAGGGCRRSRLGVININRTTHPRNRQFPSKQLPGYLIAILNSSREAVFRSQPVLD